MFFRNPDPDRALSFIANSAFDVFCLQEVPEVFLERLKTLPCNIAFALDFDRIQYGKESKQYCVMLTPHQIVASEAIRFPVAERPLRTKLFQLALWDLHEVLERGSLFADIRIAGVTVRVFCLHLTLSYPECIAQEFDTAMRKLNASVPTLVCGDFNILEKPHITVLNWLLGGRLRDIFVGHGTRRLFEKKFAQRGFQNPLRGTQTQTIARSQLDHILVPDSFSIVDAHAEGDRVGSDHCPVFVECLPSGGI